MKRGTPEHPKVHALAALLNVPRYAAVGILESLWHFAQEYAQAGDIGRFPDDAIARWVCWDGASTVLIEALNQSNWIDRCDCHRLRIHDWPDHADQTVKRVLESRGQRLLACYDDPSTVLAPSQLPCRAVAVPLPSQTVAVASQQAAANGPAISPVNSTPVALQELVARNRVQQDQRPANPLVAGRRVDLEREFLALVSEIAKLTDRDPLEVAREATGYEGARTTPINPASMSDDRLANSVMDLRSNLGAAKKRQEAESRGIREARR